MCHPEWHKGSVSEPLYLLSLPAYLPSLLLGLNTHPLYLAIAFKRNDVCCGKNCRKLHAVKNKRAERKRSSNGWNRRNNGEFFVSKGSKCMRKAAKKEWSEAYLVRGCRGGGLREGYESKKMIWQQPIGQIRQ